MDVTLHIGLPKTATTTLQEETLQKTDRLFPVLPASRVTDSDLAKIVRDLLHADDTEADRLRQEFQRQLKEANEGEKPVVVSYENFTFPSKIDVQAAPRIARKFFGDVRIVMMLRNQFQWLESLYFYQQSKRIHRGKLQLPEEFVAAEMKKKEHGAFAVFNLNGLVARWETEFGKNRMTIVPYEVIKTNPLEMVKPFAKGNEELAFSMAKLLKNAPRERDRLSVDEFNRGLFYASLRRSGTLRFKIAKAIGLIDVPSLTYDQGRPRFDFSKILPECLISSIRKGNAELAKRRNLDLEGFGYPL